ncbi:hypothetical protein BCR32DRAFT_330449 [Anaeromyces robustus]|uniref:Transglutaminase-like domain-containing protein n=1 Tax=Anaeromyces robustus TaxID=1754192 RepID=A0A1Y1VUS2_9FUNG|nr:hypothetical protein BCR32DRAFT_330449 [Anaeromyces robustus]|eukprot:ORX65041.1 hypothetical protein BCR32DRAFT_330449 [Anaeromyces robustus]
MKLLSVLLLVILNFCLINSAPVKDQYNGVFHFKITSSNKCAIVGLDDKNKNAKELIIPEAFYVEGKKYYVTGVNMGAFANNSKLEKVTFNPSSTTVTIYYYAFYNNVNLTKVIFNNNNIIVNYAAFSGCNKLNFDGSGIPKIVENLAKQQLKEWNLPVGNKGYNEASTESRNKKMTDLYRLAKKIYENYDRFSTYGSGYNLPGVLIFHGGNIRGLHMAYRELARVMGVDEVHFLTASDAVSTFWSYIRFDYDKWYDTWYNVDIFNYDYSKYKGNSYPSNFFMINSKFIDHLVNEVNTALPYENKKRPDWWYVYTAVYGTDYEGELVTRVLIDDYIKQHNLGGDRA